MVSEEEACELLYFLSIVSLVVLKYLKVLHVSLWRFETQPRWSTSFLRRSKRFSCHTRDVRVVMVRQSNQRYLFLTHIKGENHILEFGRVFVGLVTVEHSPFVTLPLSFSILTDITLLIQNPVEMP